LIFCVSVCDASKHPKFIKNRLRIGKLNIFSVEGFASQLPWPDYPGPEWPDMSGTCLGVLGLPVQPIV
jgi:hypothetical protein